MGYFSNLEVEVMDLAHEGVDVCTIANITGLSVHNIEDIIQGDPDIDPAEFMELSADIDAEYYGV